MDAASPFIILALVALLTVLGALAQVFGVDSRDGFDGLGDRPRDTRRYAL